MIVFIKDKIMRRRIHAGRRTFLILIEVILWNDKIMMMMMMMKMVEVVVMGVVVVIETDCY